MRSMCVHKWAQGCRPQCAFKKMVLCSFIVGASVPVTQLCAPGAKMDIKLYQGVSGHYVFCVKCLPALCFCRLPVSDLSDCTIATAARACTVWIGCTLIEQAWVALVFR